MVQFFCLGFFCTIPGAQSGYRIYVKTVPAPTGAVFIVLLIYICYNI